MSGAWIHTGGGDPTFVDVDEVLPLVESAQSVISKNNRQTAITDASVSWPRALTVRDECEPKWTVLKCSCGTKAVPKDCHRLRCWKCAGFLRDRRATAIEKRFEENRRGRAVIYLVATVTPDRREAAADPATWTRWRRKLVKWLKKNAGFAWGVERTDPAGDQDPTSWHPHLNLLLIQRDGFRPWQDVEALREEWARIVDPAPDLFGEKVVDVHVEYCDGSTPKKYGKLLHWYSYMGRTWPAWAPVVKRHLHVRWMGKYPPSPPKESTGCCPECGEDFEVILRNVDEVTARKLVRVELEALSRPPREHVIVISA